MSDSTVSLDCFCFFSSKMGRGNAFKNTPTPVNHLLPQEIANFEIVPDRFVPPFSLEAPSSHSCPFPHIAQSNAENSKMLIFQEATKHLKAALTLTFSIGGQIISSVTGRVKIRLTQFWHTSPSAANLEKRIFLASWRVLTVLWIYSHFERKKRAITAGWGSALQKRLKKVLRTSETRCFRS